VLFGLCFLLGIILCCMCYASGMTLQTYIDDCLALAGAPAGTTINVGSLSGVLDSGAAAFSVSLILCYACGVAWLLGMKHIARGMAVTCLVLKPVFMVIFGIWIMIEFSESATGITFIVL
jgi:hypothetical protein